MSYTKNKYQTTGEFFKDVKRGIDDIALRLDNVEKRQEEVTAGGIQQVWDEPSGDGSATVQPFQYEGPFAVISKEEGYRSKYTGTSYTTITEITTAGAHLSSGYDMEHYIGTWISSGAVNINNKRIQIAGKGSSVSSGSTHTNYYVAIPDNYNLFLRIPAVKRGKLNFADAYSEDVFDSWIENHSASYQFIAVSEGINPTYADWEEIIDYSSGTPITSSIKGQYEYVMIAQNRGGKLIQTQFGEITDVPQDYVPPFASSAGIANYASEAGYRGPFHVERAGSTNYSSGSLHGFVNIYDNANFYSSVDSTNIPYAGHIVQGASHFVVPGGYMVPVDYGQDGVANIYLYRDEYDASSPYKFSAVVSGATENPFSSFYTRLAVDFLGAIKQTQFGDIVDVDSGGSTIINSSSFYSSTINVTSTYIDSRSYSSTIISGGGIQYNGAFIVSGGISSGGTSDVFLASCYDGQGRQYGGSDIAGYVIAGNMRHPVYISSGFALIDGAKVYLIGSANRTNHTATYEISALTGTPTTNNNQWYTQLAYKEGGQVYQTQFGDIVAPYEVPYASSSFRASNGGVQSVSAGNANVTVNPTSGNVFVSATGGGSGGGGMGFPDYAALAGGTGGVVISPSTNTSSGYAGYTATADGWLRLSIRNGGITDGCFRLYLNNNSVELGMFQYKTYAGGVTYIIPIQNGTSINYYSPTSENYVVFAPSINGGGLPFPVYGNLTNNSSSGHKINSGETYQTPAAGWLRVSIRNAGLSDGCFTLNIGGTSFGVFQYRSGCGGVTQFYPVPANTNISFSTPASGEYLVKFDH